MGIHTGIAIDGEVEDYLLAILPESLDFGDAPEPYPTLAIDLGAKHIIGEFFLGDVVDPEPDGQPDPNALGDDDVGAVDDEDGIIFLEGLNVGETSDVEVSVTTPIVTGGYLNAWIDFDQNGIWDEMNEQIITDELLFVGVDTLEIAIPDTAAKGTTFARFRFSPAAGLKPIDPLPFNSLDIFVGEWERRKSK